MNDTGRPRGFIPFAPQYRASGVLLHVSSLPSPYGIGDVGPAALAVVDRLHAAGQSWWQALPLGPTGYGNSPYQSLSSFAGNDLLVGPDGLIEDGLLHADDCDEGRSLPKNAADYNAVIPFKHKLLARAWSSFSSKQRSALRLDYDRFCLDQAYWLDDYAFFRALKAKHGGAYYLDWPAEFVRRDPAALARARHDLAELIEQVRFAQFSLFRQGKRLREDAHAAGIHLIGDLPFFVSPDSSDVWANPDFFLLDEHRRPRFVAGVPPDYFSAQGQLWGNPVYDWEALRRTGYRWCIERLRALLAHVDVVRLDHFRGFSAAWYVPAGWQRGVAVHTSFRTLDYGRYKDASRQHARMGIVRRTKSGVSGQCAAAFGNRASHSGRGFADWLGAIRRSRRRGAGYAYFRYVSADESRGRTFWLYSGPCSGGRERGAGSPRGRITLNAF
jgi:4-alpha-glucanotransferase